MLFMNKQEQQLLNSAMLAVKYPDRTRTKCFVCKCLYFLELIRGFPPASAAVVIAKKYGFWGEQLKIIFKTIWEPADLLFQFKEHNCC